ncbi:MAG TPA: PH domain-containing protein [Blastocatellia bacterium]|nr:PH domain-containing protein [Blastocatellia bacterium]
MGSGIEKTTAWLYQGIWGILVRWFAVPAAPPDLPAREGEKIERVRPSEGFVRYLKLWFWLGLTFVDGLLFIGWVLSFFVSIWLGLALAPLFFVVAILPDILAYVGIHLRYDTTWYVFSDRSLRIRRGIWTIKEATITFENIQDVKIHQGPVERYFGIADVIVETAGGGGAKSNHQGAGSSASHTGLIEGIGDAERIRDLIMARVRKSRKAGIGDEDLRSQESARRTGLLWTPEHIAVLGEIRAELAKLRE